MILVSALVYDTPYPEEGQELVDGSTLEHAKILQERFRVKKMTKSELKRIKNDAFLLLKNSSESAIEVEYHLENIARAMSNNMDWLNPEANIDFTKRTTLHITPTGLNLYQQLANQMNLGFHSDISSTKTWNFFYTVAMDQGNTLHL